MIVITTNKRFFIILSYARSEVYKKKCGEMEPVSK